ncbi:MAG: tetratricopeptide repeat protein [Gemmatimonadota bacterium]
MRCIGRLLAAGMVALAAGCASSGQLGTDGMSRLEKSRQSRPNDAAVARSLGIAYYKATKYPEARTHLEASVRLDPRDGAAALYLGLTAEQQKDMAGAKSAYQTYIRYGKTSKVRKQLEARLAAITRQDLQLAARAAVAQEQQLATQQGNITTVAVMPLRFVGPDTSLQPLERGLAELITTDLSRTDQLIVVERARLQALLNEIELQKSGATDSTTNVRAGKLIQAGRIVNGQILQSADRLRVDAAIVNTTTSLIAGGATNENTLEELFAIEKAIVLQLFDSLGVKLTSAHRKELDDRPTRSLPAFLAFSRGLQFEDQGRYDDAARSYQDAFRIDPSFFQAQVKGADVAAAATGVSLTASNIESNIVGTAEANIAQKSAEGQAPQSPNNEGNGAGSMADQVNPSAAGGATASAGGSGSGGGSSGGTPSKDPVGAATGAESTAKTAIVRIVVKLPRP